MYGIDDFIESLPPSTINNSRAIVRGMVSSFEKRPSEGMAGRIEAITGICADYTNADMGEEPRELVDNE